jgi:hypothetical protein
MIHAVQLVYIQLEILNLPLPAEIALICHDVIPVWLPALAAAISGIPFARRGEAEKIQRWAIVMVLLMLFTAVNLAALLTYPLMHVQTGLRNR